MLGHLVIDGLDPNAPASASPALIAVLRRDFGYDGVLVTDDAAMAPYRADLAAHAIATLRSGADFVLASWDPDVAFDVIAVLGKAVRDDEAFAGVLKSSDARVAAQKQPRPP